MRVKAWNKDVLVADYLFAESKVVDAFMFAAGMKAKSYKIEMEKFNV